MRKIPKYTLPVWATVLVGAGLSLFAELFTIWLQHGSFMATIGCFMDAPELWLLNFWPMVVCAALFYCLLGNIFWSGALTTLVWGVLSYINLVKVEARGDPFVPGDVALLTEGMEAAGSYELNLHLGLLAMLIGCCLVLAAVGVVLKSPKPRWYFRSGGAVLVAGLFVWSMATVYTDKDRYQNLPGPDRSNVPKVFESFGFPYCFLYNFNLYPVDVPDGYDRATAAGYEQTYLRETVTPEVMPNILFVMCEAFTDLPNEAAFTYSEADNPIAFFNALCRQEGTLSGHLVVSNVGAGTANTEFDILTGMSTNTIGTGTTSAFRVVHRNTDTIVRALASVGYESYFMHPGQNWFYNRESVYSYFGITDQTFQEAFTVHDYKGNWIADVGFLRVLKENLLLRQEGAPLIAYTVTIQNHQAYTYSKYGFVPEAAQVSVEVSDKTAEYLSVYMEGLRDSDAMLEELVAFLETQEEPYLLVFFGDHQPTLGADRQAYRELGLYSEETVEDRIWAYEVPFLIWGNAAYQETTDLMAAAEEIGVENGCVLSSNYLGAMTLRLAGFQGLDGYFDYLEEMRGKLPVCSVYGCLTADGTWYNNLPEALAAWEDTRWKWQYYRLKHQSVD